MAQLTITVPDATVPRIKAAFGKNGIPATNQEVLDGIQLMVKRRVLDFEAYAIKRKADIDGENLTF